MATVKELSERVKAASGAYSGALGVLHVLEGDGPLTPKVLDDAFVEWASGAGPLLAAMGAFFGEPEQRAHWPEAARQGLESLLAHTAYDYAKVYAELDAFARRLVEPKP